MRAGVEIEALKVKLSDRWWRLNNLYWITDKEGRMVKFKPNWAQTALHRRLHTRCDVLKARQLGISTYTSILALDCCLFTQNFSSGIIDKTKEDAYAKVGKMELAFNNLDYVPEAASREEEVMAKLGGWLKRQFKLRGGKSALEFNNGSKVKASASFRGGTFQLLHISELGYTAAHAPIKAREITTGGFNAVSKGGIIIRESTHEGGKYGINYELTKKSMEMVGKKLSPLDWRFFFFPWWKSPEYVLDVDDDWEASQEVQDYFAELEKADGIIVTPGQMRWYEAQYNTFGGMTRQEYPSTPEEAFHALVEGSIYGSYIDKLRAHGRLLAVFEKDDLAPYYVSWDIGMADYMSMWLWQVRGDGKFYVMDCLQANDKPLEWYINYIRTIWEREFGAIYKHLVPHDASKRDANGIGFDTHLRRAGFNVTVVPRINDVWVGIFAVRRLLNHCVFHERCSRPQKIDGVEYMSGVNALENYQKAPVGASGVERDTPLHNRCSHAADAFRTFAEAKEKGLIGKVGAIALSRSVVEHRGGNRGLGRGANSLFV